MREAVSLATLDGLDGLSIGNLADALEMSKSGVYAHFGSKQDLQLATLDEAGKIFGEEVIEPTLTAQPADRATRRVVRCVLRSPPAPHAPRRLLLVRCRRRDGTRPGPVKEQITVFQGALIALIRELIVTAIDAGDLSDDEDPDALAFELSGVMFAANANFVLRDDTGAVEMARGIVHRRLGINSDAVSSKNPPPPL